MITPRGYANKYDQLTGEAKEGEKAGRSLSMGLDGWHAVVRKFMQGEQEKSLRDVTRHFNTTPAEIASAIAGSDRESPAGGYQAIAIEPARLFDALQASSQLGRIRAVVRAEAGAVSEMLLNQPNFIKKGDWVSIENEHFHLHVNWSQASQGWFVHHDEKLLGIQFFNAEGNSLLNLSVVKEGEAFPAEAIKHYHQIVQQFALPLHAEVAVNE